MEYLIVKWLHVLSSTILFGTGIGTAFYMLAAAIEGNVPSAAIVHKWVVRGDWIFTGTAGLLQPLTGFYLIHLAGYPLRSRWIMWSLGLYVLALACWLPVVWLQIRLRDMALGAAATDAALPPLYRRYLFLWIALGIPAFFALVTVFYLMIAKPA
ncbi:MAG TPA: DUF2269 domain-containing protein [Telluria sp.]|nr:DUF2269 domain-containing protein [Telluria sp.]